MDYTEGREMTKVPWHKTEEEIQSVREVGRLTWLYYEKPEDPADDNIHRMAKRSHHSPRSSGIYSGERGTKIIKKFSGGFPMQNRDNGRRGGHSVGLINVNWDERALK